MTNLLLVAAFAALFVVFVLMWLAVTSRVNQLDEE